MSETAFHHDPVAGLVRGANQIGEYFGAFPDRGEALDGIADHIRKFWEPRMRRQLYAHLDRAAGDDGLLDIVRDAVTQRRQDLEPAAP